MLVLHDKPINCLVEFLIEGSVPTGSALSLFVGSSLSTTSVTAVSLGTPDITRVSFTPTSTGLHTIVAADGSIAAYVDVVSKTQTAYLSNIEDEALGSWAWNKTEGTLELLRQDGSGLATFAVIDTMTESSRERIL